MEWIGTALSSPYTWQVIIGLVVVIMLVIVMAKTGILKIHTRAVSIGDYESGKKINQKVVRRQIEYAEAFCTNLLADISNMYPDQAFGGWKVRCILELIYDEIIKWISFNHITSDDIYITNKVEVIRSIVMKNNPADFFKTPEFEDNIRKWCTQMIKQLVLIREDTLKEGKR